MKENDHYSNSRTTQESLNGENSSGKQALMKSLKYSIYLDEKCHSYDLDLICQKKSNYTADGKKGYCPSNHDLQAMHKFSAETNLTLNRKPNLIYTTSKIGVCF